MMSRKMFVLNNLIQIILCFGAENLESTGDLKGERPSLEKN